MAEEGTSWECRPWALSFWIPNRLSPPLLWQDWDTVERREEAPSGDNFTVMIPRKSQEVPRADGARKAPPLLTQSPVGGGDTAGQKKEGKYLLPGQVGP